MQKVITLLKANEKIVLEDYIFNQGWKKKKKSWIRLLY